MTNYRWRIVVLLFVATTINYLDRQVISLLKPTLETVFSWTETDYSHIVMVFQGAYALSYVVFGRLIDIIGTKIWTINRSRKTAMLLCALCIVPIALIRYATSSWPA